MNDPYDLCLVPIFRSTVILSILLFFHPFFGHGLFRGINSYSLISRSSRRERPLIHSWSFSGSNGFQKFGNTCFEPRQKYFSPRCFISKGGGFPRVVRGFLKSLLWCNFLRCSVSQTAMWTLLIVISLEYPDQRPCMIHMMEYFHIQAFVPNRSIKPFIHSILPWWSWLYVSGCYSLGGQPSG